MNTRILPVIGHLLCAALLAACTNENNEWDEEDPAFQQQPLPVATAAATPQALAAEDGIPLVQVARVGNVRGTYAYSLQGAEYPEQEFLGLCRSMLRSNPQLKIRLSPSASLSQDEIGLVTARIRETGVENVAVVDMDGRER